MDFSELALHFVIILTPGILATLIYQTYALKKKFDAFYFSAYALLLGMVSYLLLQLLFFIPWLFQGVDNSIVPYMLGFWDILKETTEGEVAKNISFSELLYASLMSLPVGALASFLSRNAYVFKFGRKAKLTRKASGGSTFYDFMRDKKLSGVYYRDSESGLTYHGKVGSYSESDKTREMVLLDVDVYDFKKGNSIKYKVPKMFISKNIESDLRIEKAK